MAKVTITLEDDKGEEGVKIRMEFDPSAKKNELATPAQDMALIMVEAAKQASENGEV